MNSVEIRFRHRHRVRNAEVDAHGILFNARYLDLMDAALTEYFRAAGATDPADYPDGATFRIARIAIDYAASFRLDEMIDIGVRCARVGRTSVLFAFDMAAEGDARPRATAEMVRVHVDVASGRPSPVPDAIVARLDAIEQRNVRA